MSKFLAEVDRDDVGALFGQPDRMAAALTTCGAGDECDFPGNPAFCAVSHVQFLSLMMFRVRRVRVRCYGRR